MSICENRKAFHEYFIEERLEVGLVLAGWEVKAIRQGKVQITDAHVVEREGELVMIGAHITPLTSASSHEPADPTRTRKILAKRKEIDRLVTKRKVAGYTIVALNMHWKNGKVKLELGLAKGKKQHDKREVAKERDGQREVQRAMKQRAPRAGE